MGFGDLRSQTVQFLSYVTPCFFGKQQEYEVNQTKDDERIELQMAPEMDTINR